MKVLDHIGIAVEKIEPLIPLFTNVLGLKLDHREELPDRQLRVAVFKTIKGTTAIELLEPTSPESTVAKFLEKKGQGVHHIAFRVGDIESEMNRLRNEGITMIDSKPRPGAHDTTVAFMHPSSTGKVLMEICQHKEE